MSIAATANEKPMAQNSARKEILFSLPGIHCAGCVSKIERHLNARADVQSARVNLSLKRVRIMPASAIDARSMIKAIDEIGFEAKEIHADPAQMQSRDQGKALLLRMGVAAFAMMNIMLLSVSNWAGATGSTGTFLNLVAAMIGIPVVLYSGQPFFQSAFRALSRGSLNMDVPISLAIALATGMSLYETLTGGNEPYFEAAVSLIFFLLAGRYLDYRTRAMARSAAQDLLALEEQDAWLVGQNGVTKTALKSLEKGQIIRIFPGQRVSVDGVIVAGRSDLDTSALTGESLPLSCGLGDEVHAGTQNMSAPIDIRVETVGRDTSLQQMASLIEIAENARTRYNSLSDQAARIYAPLVHGLALAGFVIWMVISGDWQIAMNVAIATLIITCPCALGLAVPAVNTVASSVLFRHHILIKNETALERLAQIDHVVFDKTGTLTLGKMTLSAIQGDENHDLALALAQYSRHPLSVSLAAALQEKGVHAAKIDDVEEVAGMGVRALANGYEARLGRAEWVGVDDGGCNQAATWLRYQDVITEFRFDDRPRENVAKLLSDLKAEDIDLSLYSGDREEIVARFAAPLGFDEVKGALLPEAKAAEIQNMVDQGHHVLMVGDGINDAVALSTATVSMSPSTAMDIAQNRSDIVYLDHDLSAIKTSFLTARSARKRILENFALAAIYNSIAIPLALTGFASPLVAAIAMSTSSIIVVLNAQRVRWSQ